MEYIKQKFSTIKQVEYFSYGCGGQNRNYKNILNLWMYQSYFGIKVNWYFFFATSHRKSPCNGIGVTAKQSNCTYKPTISIE